MNLDLLKELIKTPGISGFESRIRNFIKNEIKDKNLDSIFIDKLGNLICIKNGESDKKILLISHMDELGLVVSSIDESGFIGFKKIGGIEDQILISRVVKILGEKEVFGVIGFLPPHLIIESKSNEVIPWHSLKIDIGAKSKEEVLNKGIKIGDPIIFEKEVYFIDDFVISRGIDDRFGCFILLNLINEYKDKKPKNSLIFVFSTEEEIGLRGASVIAPQLNPDLIIAVDSVSSTDIYNTPTVYKNSVLVGNGPVIRKVDARMIVDEELFEFVYNLAKKENIPIQIAVSGGSTDASISETSYIGYKSIPICFPVRYTHSTVEISSLKDGENLIKLLNVLINYEL
jgi:putative aminopeptidase FrvX